MNLFSMNQPIGTVCSMSVVSFNCGLLVRSSSSYIRFPLRSIRDCTPERLNQIDFYRSNIFQRNYSGISSHKLNLDLKYQNHKAPSNRFVGLSNHGNEFSFVKADFYTLFLMRKNFHLICDRYSTEKKVNIYRNLVTKEQQMIPSIFSRILSTLSMQKRTIGSGVSIENEIDNVLSKGKGNKSIKINACGKLYCELAKSKPELYYGAPKDTGIDFEVQYYDSIDLLEATNVTNAPTICLLHGAPGHYEDYASLINYMVNKNIRVIAPNFPDYSATFDHSFRHSPKERLDFLLEFLKSINVKQLSMLVGHSSAVYTMFELLSHNVSDPSNTVKVESFGLFSTPTYNLPPNMAVTPFRLFTLKLFDYKFLRPVIMALIHNFVKLQGIRNRVDKDKIDNLLIAASAVGYSDCEKTVDQLKLIRKFKVPVFVLIGCKDRLIPMKCFEQLKRDLDISNDTQVKYYSGSGELVQDVSKFHNSVEVSQFESGGHYTFQKYSKQVNDDIYAFLNRKVFIYGEKTKL